MNSSLIHYGLLCQLHHLSDNLILALLRLPHRRYERRLVGNSLVVARGAHGYPTDAGSYLPRIWQRPPCVVGLPFGYFLGVDVVEQFPNGLSKTER